MCHEIRRTVLAREATRRAAEKIDTIEPDCGKPRREPRLRRWWGAIAAAILGAAAIAPVHGQPFDAVVGAPALELAPAPVCTESMLEGISYEQAGVKRYLVLPESTPQVWYLLGISNATGLDAGVAISAVDCSVTAVVNDPAQRRPYCRHLPNPGPFCVGINVGPATRN